MNHGYYRKNEGNRGVYDNTVPIIGSGFGKYGKSELEKFGNRYSNRFSKPAFNDRKPTNPGGGPLNSNYDGKRIRKPVVRRYVDFSNCSLVSNFQKIYNPSKKNRFKYIPPHGSFHPSLLQNPVDYKNNPVTSVATKFVHTSINKNRCPINVVVWTPEGRRLITGAATGEFTLWNGYAFNFETIQQAHDGPIRAMTWSHSEKFMVSSDNIGYIKYWQSNMNNLKVIRGHSECIRDICFSPNDGKFVSCSDDSTLKLWDFKACQAESALQGHGTDVRCCDWHPRSSLIASGGKDYKAKIWDARTSTFVSDLHGHSNTVVRVKWNMNGNWLLTCGRDRNIKVFDIRFMKDFQTFKGHPREITSLDWHPVHERLFASGGYDGSLFYWVIGQRNAAGKVLTAHDSSIWDLKWNPIGNVLATGSNDHCTRFWVRNKPGDRLRDKFNICQMPEGTELELPRKKAIESGGLQGINMRMNQFGAF